MFLLQIPILTDAYIKGKNLNSNLFKYPGTMRVHILVLAVLFNFVAAHPSLVAQGENTRFYNLTSDDGLLQNSVLSIIQDKHGFMWFATLGGVSRYDGKKFVSYQFDPEDRNSLSSNYVRTLAEDNDGIIWIGTENGGLNRLDPVTNRITHYKYDAQNPDSLMQPSSNYIDKILISSSGYVWIATWGGGLNRLNPADGTFKYFKHKSGDSTSLSTDFLQAMAEDENGIIWIGGRSASLDRFDPVTETITRYRILPSADDRVSSLYIDRSNQIWAGTTNQGLVRFNRESKTFQFYRHDPKNSNSISGNKIKDIHEDALGVLWIATENSGLNRFNPEKEHFERFFATALNTTSLSSNHLLSLAEDRSGNIWVGMAGWGVERVIVAAKEFKYLKGENGKAGATGPGFIWAIYGDKKGSLWAGTEKGLITMDQSSRRFKSAKFDAGSSNPLPEDLIFHVYPDRNNTLWIAGMGGLFRYNMNTKKAELDSAFNKVSEKNIIPTRLLEDKNGNFWIGSYDGLFFFDAKTRQFSDFGKVLKDSKISGIAFWSLFEDRFGKIWAGGRGGLYYIDPKTSTFFNYEYNENDPTSINSDEIYAINTDLQGDIWVGTSHGLNKFVAESNSFIRFTQKDGLPNNTIYGILADNENNLWLSTNRGLSKYNLQTEIFKNYDINDGLHSNEFNAGSFFKNPQTGQMYFGGVDGITTFFPEKIKDNALPPAVVITDIQLFNKSVEIGEKSYGRVILEKSITHTESITLSHREDMVSLTFAALHYTYVPKNEYAYMLEGFDTDWNYCGNRRFATYTNLPDGTYSFRVKAANSDGTWNEVGTRLEIIVLPPFWETWWFKAGSVIFLLMFTGGIFHLRTRSIRARNKTLEYRVARRTRKLKIEIGERKKTEVELVAAKLDAEKAKIAAEFANKSKSDFLANMSHELRTPLNSLLLLANDIKSNKTGNLSEDQVESATIIYNSGNDLLTLINEILDLSKIEAGKQVFTIEETNIQNMADSTFMNFKRLAKEKNLPFKVIVDDALPATIQTDSQRIHQIIKNFLANALKFTTTGSVTVHFKQPDPDMNFLRKELKRGSTIAISVVDTGIGVAEDKQKDIFSEFQQADNSTSRKYGGTGLGLSISQKLARLLGGEIQLKSTLGKGSAFTLFLPYVCELDPENTADSDKTVKGSEQTQHTNRSSGVIKNAIADDRQKLSTTDPVILVIEDDVNFARIIYKFCARNGFKCIHAVDGESGLQQAGEIQPEGILLDIQLPGINGWGVLEALKKNEKTASIPVYMLSVNDDPGDVVEKGALGYFTKPINMDQLQQMLNGIDIGKGKKRAEFNPRSPPASPLLMSPATIDPLREEVCWLWMMICAIFLRSPKSCGTGGLKSTGRRMG